MFRSLRNTIRRKRAASTPESPKNSLPPPPATTSPEGESSSVIENAWSTPTLSAAPAIVSSKGESSSKAESVWSTPTLLYASSSLTGEIPEADKAQTQRDNLLITNLRAMYFSMHGVLANPEKLQQLPTQNLEQFYQKYKEAITQIEAQQLYKKDKIARISLSKCTKT